MSAAGLGGDNVKADDSGWADIFPWEEGGASP